MKTIRKFFPFIVAGMFSLFSSYGDTQEIKNRQQNLENKVQNASKDGSEKKEIKTIYDIPYLKVDLIETEMRLDAKEFHPINNEGRYWGYSKKVDEKDLVKLTEDFKFLGWPSNAMKIGESWYINPISSDGKFLYNLSYLKETEEDDSLVGINEGATVLFDQSHSKKFILRYLPKNQRVFEYKDAAVSKKTGKEIPRKISFPGHIDNMQMSKSGRVLQFGFNKHPKNFQVGDLYFIDLNSDMRVLYHQTDTCNSGKGYNYRFSEDESIYFTGSHLVNIFTGKTVRPRWYRWDPTDFYTETFAMSSDCNYISARFGVFSASTFVEGQWGLEVHTPKGHYVINSPTTSLFEGKVQNDGTIMDSRGYVLEFHYDTYKCVKGPNGKLLNDLNVSKY